MAVFRNLLAHPFQLEGDWWVSLAEIIVSTSKKLLPQHFVSYTLLHNRWNFQRMWTIEFRSLEGVGPTMKLMARVNTRRNNLLWNFWKRAPGFTNHLSPARWNWWNLFSKKFTVSVLTIEVCRIYLISSEFPTETGLVFYFVFYHKEVEKAELPITGKSWPDLPAGRTMFFVNTSIIEQQHIAGVKSLLRNFDTDKELCKGKLQITSTTAVQVFSELDSKKFNTITIEKSNLNLSVTGQNVPLLGTGRVALTLGFWKI